MDGSIRQEDRTASQRVFANTALAHVVIPYEYKPVLDAWTTDALRAQREGAPTLFMLRLVRWDKLWLVLTVNFDAMYSVAVVADDWGYELSVQMFTRPFGRSRREVFPFTSPTTRTLRPVLVRVENKCGRPERFGRFLLLEKRKTRS